LAGIRRALAPSGQLLILDMMAHDRADLRDSMGHAWQGFAHDQLSGWGRDAGFSDCRFAPLPPQPSAQGPSLFVASLSRVA